MNLNQENNAAVLAKEVIDRVGEFVRPLKNSLAFTSDRLDLSNKSPQSGNRNSLLG